MTTYTGPVTFLSDSAAFGDGDESSFNVMLSGSITLSLSADQSGVVTGTATVGGVVSGYTTTDTDGDNDAFSDDISGTSSAVSGSLTTGVSVSFTYGNGSISFQGTFQSADEDLVGTVNLSDENLGMGIAAPVGLFTPDGPGLSETVIPAISSPAEFVSSTDAAGDWTDESDPVTFDDSTGTWSLNSYHGVIDGVNFVASEVKYYTGVGITALINAASDEASEAVLNQIEEISPQVDSALSNANEALSLYQTLKTFQEDSMNLIERGINSIMGTDDLTAEEFDQQATQIAQNLQTNLISQLTGIPASVLTTIENYADKLVSFFSDSSPIFEVYEGDGSLGGNPSDTYGILGGTSNVTLVAGAGNSVLYAGSGSDTLVAGSGNEWLIGGSGFDEAVFSGDESAYTITRNADGSITVAGSTGSDTLVQISELVFADNTVNLTTPTPPTFQSPTFVLSSFGSNPSAGWGDQATYPVELGDVTGNGMDDIVGFGAAGVYVSLATGSGNFAQPTLALSDLGADAGWGNQNQYPIELGDVTGSSGEDDIVAFGASGVYVALANGNGTFAQPTLALSAFDADAGWGDQATYPVELGDVTGNGLDDIVGFGASGVYVALATGNGTFQQPILALSDFGADAGWGNQNQYPIELGDVTGNGREDIVAFGSAGVYVALANGDGTFAQPILALSAFGADAGWGNQNLYPIELADVTGNGLDDIVAFGSAGVYVALANGDGTFQQPVLALSTDFGTASGWTSQNQYPRLLGDVTGNGLADILGFGSSGVYELLASIDPPMAAAVAPVTVADGATVDLGALSAAAVTFSGPSGTLQLDQSTGFSGTIAGFGGQDQIDLSDIAFTANTTLGYAANSGNTGGTLSVGNGAATANLSLLGQYMASSFVASSDGLGGTLVSEAAQAAQAMLTHSQTTA